VSSAFRSICEQVKNNTIIYDAQLAGQISIRWFDPEYWQSHAEVQALAITSRGQTWRIQTADKTYVLRHYHRGGLVAKYAFDRYLWLGLMRTRAWREYQLLVKLQEFNLPAPRPLAARVQQQGWFYRADLITNCIPNSRALSRILVEHTLDTTLWQSIGACIRAFHRRNIYHVNLNVHNILLDNSDHIYLINFDRSNVDQDQSWQQRSLLRLYQSLLKLKAQDSHVHFNETNWQALLAGYHA
jgi:3-deoxy-D-manno-octulosonic acid kinase